MDDELMFGTKTLFIRHVVWYPQGNEEDSASEPFVYVVIGPKRGGAL